MNLEATEQDVFEALRDIEVIDAHEHLVPEAERIARKVDFFILFSHYTKADLISAGMEPKVYERLVNDESMSAEEKWQSFSPFYPMVRHGSYARPAQIWLNHVLGCDELTEVNCREVSERIQDTNRPGLYQRVLRDMCNIQSALVDNAEFHEQYDMDILKPLWRITNCASEGAIRQHLNGPRGEADRTLDGYLDWVQREGERLRDAGAFGLKMVCFPYERPDMKEAETVFMKLANGEARHGLTRAERMTLQAVVCDRAFQFARQHNLTVACHSGVWGDFRESQPCHLIPMAMAHPDVSFDLFHLGMPFVREAVMIGKMFPNVSLNLCWDSVVSPELTVRMLDECIDMVPLNNVIVFGADYRIAVEKVYGHLVMAKEIVARVLAKRIRAGQMDLEEAVRIAKLWFHDNAVRIYSL